MIRNEAILRRGLNVLMANIQAQMPLSPDDIEIAVNDIIWLVKINQETFMQRVWREIRRWI